MNAGRRWWLLRHAPVAPDHAGRINGQVDIPVDLSDTAAIARQAARLPPAPVWITSTLARAKDTARALATAAGQTPEFWADGALDEVSFGEWEGLRWDDLKENVSKDFWADFANNRAPGGESFSEMAARVQVGMDAIAARLGPGKADIVIVAHSGTLRAAAARALPGGIEAALALQLPPLSLLVLAETGRGGWALEMSLSDIVQDQQQDKKAAAGKGE